LNVVVLIPNQKEGDTIMKNFIERHPFWFALGFTIIVMQLFGLVVAVVGRTLGFPEIPVRVAAAAVTTIVPLFFIWRLGWWEDVGLVSTTQNVYALAVPLILTFFPLVFFGTYTMEPQRVQIFLLAVLFTGISEEVVYRGLFIRAFLPRGKWQAVLLPAVIFAAAHIVQSLGGGMSFEENLTQIANAFFYGVMLGAVRLRINNVWPLIILHTIIDLFWVTSGLADGVYLMTDIPLSIYLVEWVPSILAAVYLMRKPIAATIDGKPVGIMEKTLVASRLENQPAD
jgi:membrane protease YdiL (CAAX protease family)